MPVQCDVVIVIDKRRRAGLRLIDLDLMTLMLLARCYTIIMNQ